MKPGRVRVKVCGITNVRDAVQAVHAGADALGFIFAASPRKMTPAAVKKITASVSPLVSCVGVFVNEKPARMMKIAKACGLDTLQLHGDETPADCRKLKGFKVIKVFKSDSALSEKAMRRYPVDAYMIETASDVRGGSGKTWDWKRIRGKKFAKPVIVTGGLRADNVAEAVRTTRCYAVDVSSGVEKMKRLKDHALVERFIHNAKKAL